MKSLLRLLQYILIITAVTNCSSSEDEFEDVPLGEDSQFAEGNNIGAENDLGEGEEGNFEQGNEGNFEGEEGNFDNVNSDTDNDFEGQGNNLLNNNFNGDEDGNFQDNEGLEFNNQGQQDFNNQGQQIGQDAFDEGANLNNAEDDMFENGQQTDFQNAAVDNGMEEEMEPVDTSGGGMVKYVRNASSLYDKPNGSTVNRLEKGDHPLVFGEGEWIRTSDGYYVPERDLTPNPVGRNRLRSIWLN